MINNKDIELAQKVLAYLVRMDIVKCAISSLGSATAVDSNKLNNLVYEKVTTAVANNKSEGAE